MLGNTFCHLPGIGPKSESTLWGAGIRTWEDFLAAESLPVSTAKALLMRQGVEASLAARRRDDAEWFAQRLRAANAWRIFPHFLSQAGYLDIETDGSAYQNITSVALYHGGEVRTYVQGENLDDFARDIQAVKVLVTFNGRCFDVPILERSFGISLPKAHVDLRFLLAAIGISGGLKACEKRFGLSRHELDGVDGWSAVLLWREWENTGRRQVLDTLLAYNVADVLGLEVLLTHALDQLLGNTPFAATHTVPIAALAENPFQPDPAVVAWLKAAPPDPKSFFRR